MIAFATENVEDVKADILPLLDLHYQELCTHKEAMALKPDWDRYTTLEQANKLLVFTARDDGKLIGYSVFFIDVHLHYADALIANNDVLYLHPDYRSKTHTGLALIQFSEHVLKQTGVTKLLWHIKFKYDWSAILLRRGYVAEDFIVSKILQEV